MKILAGRFTLLHQLGRGASGSVWLARDQQSGGSLIACKTLHAESRTDTRAINSLKREVLIARRLRHPNIGRVFSFFESTPEPFITMEYIEGRTLRSAAADSASLVPRSQLECWLTQIADALDYAHDRQVLHRDIKPSNVLCADGNGVALIDFGIASVLAEKGQAHHSASRVGTFLYMAPEVIQGRPPSPFSDQYSLAVMAYELVRGEHPSIAQRGWRTLEGYSGATSEIDEVLRRGMSDRPEERFENCRCFVSALTGSFHDVDDAVPVFERSRILGRISDDSDTRDAAWSRPVSSCLMLGEILLDNGLVSEEAIERALREQPLTGLSLGAILVGRGELSARSLAVAIAQQCRLEFVSMDEGMVDWDTADNIGIDALVRDVCVPIRSSDEGIRIAISDPLDFSALERMEAGAAAPVDWCVAARDEILNALGQAPA